MWSGRLGWARTYTSQGGELLRSAWGLCLIEVVRNSGFPKFVGADCGLVKVKKTINLLEQSRFKLFPNPCFCEGRYGDTQGSHVMNPVICEG